MEKLCRLLEISRSGYYAWLTRRQSQRAQHNQALTRELVYLHEKYPALGLDSLYHMLKANNSCSRGRIHRLMKAAGIHSMRKKAYKTTTNSRHSHPIAPNLLKRQFSFAQPNQAWVGDITYIPTGEGWLYLAAVKDLCTKKIVGYAFSSRIDTQLTLSALDMAVRRERPSPGLIFHSDRGIRQSMSRKGDPYDNAVAENFFSCLKCELVRLRQYDSRRAAQSDIFAYIEAFYNTLRPHSAIDWLSPCAFELRLRNASVA